MKFALGSAAWRSDYGSFSTGLLSDCEIENLLAKAAILGFNYIDTAPSYGDVEETLGGININQSLATKVTVDASDFSSITKSIDLSKKRLSVDSLELVFIHNWDALSQSDKHRSVEHMQNCVSENKIRSWGFSTYEISELNKISSNGWRNLTVQINSNVLDQRILAVNTPDYSADFKSRNIEIWVRSIFLQGVLLDNSRHNPYTNHPDIKAFFSACENLGISPLEMCLSYIKQLEVVDCAIIGIVNELQLIQIWAALQANVPEIDFQSLQSRDINLIDPRKWNLKK